MIFFYRKQEVRKMSWSCISHDAIFSFLLCVLQMSFLARTFSQVIARSARTTALLLKPSQTTSSALRLASTEPSQQSNEL
jgi:hypothetical protein